MTWIAPSETRNIKITAGDMDPPLGYEKPCDSGKLVINATASSGVKYSCTFCDKKGFNMTFTYPKSVTFDVVDPHKIVDKTWYRVWFEGKDKVKCKKLTNNLIGNECINSEGQGNTYDTEANSNQTYKTKAHSIFKEI